MLRCCGKAPPVRKPKARCSWSTRNASEVSEMLVSSCLTLAAWWVILESTEVSLAWGGRRAASRASSVLISSVYLGTMFSATEVSGAAFAQSRDLRAWAMRYLRTSSKMRI